MCTMGKLSTITLNFIVIYFNLLYFYPILHERNNDFVSQENVDTNSDEKCQSSAWLRNGEQVDNGVENTGTNKQPSNIKV